MTIEDKLNKITAEIRKSLPELMNLEKGCILKNIHEGVSYELMFKDKYDAWMMKYESNKDTYASILEPRHIVKNFEIMGKDPMLNHVLKWVNNIKGEIAIAEDGSLLKDGAYIYPSNSKDGKYIKWDLSKLHLKDQLEELINYLYTLI